MTRGSQGQSGFHRDFWSLSFFNKLDILATIYYRFKGILLYRFVFKSFGSGSYISRPLLILNANHISIGKNVSIRQGVRLEVVISKGGSQPVLAIGDGTNIEQNVHIICHRRVIIGSHVSITGNCAIVDLTHPYQDVSNLTKIGARIKDEDSFVEIGDGAFVGFGTVILPNVRIGAHAVVGANSVVTRDVPDYSVAAGAPAVVLKQYNLEKGIWENSRLVSAPPVHKP